jgi:3-dehydroquinate dehydratase-2|tara:strand:- start:84 stop:503 length:420 start_codon:yes stop_codon:yes gene_type:complete
MKVIIINGPNLNLLSKRDTSVYGSTSFDDYFEYIKAKFNSIDLSFYQSNIEGDIINKLQESDSEFNFIILNAGGYSHTSVAIADCVEAIDTPVIEVHISNIYARESFRHKSLVSAVSVGVIVGLGLDSYRLAIDNIINR